MAQTKAFILNQVLFALKTNFVGITEFGGKNAEQHKNPATDDKKMRTLCLEHMFALNFLKFVKLFVSDDFCHFTDFVRISPFVIVP